MIAIDRFIGQHFLTHMLLQRGKVFAKLDMQMLLIHVLIPLTS